MDSENYDLRCGTWGRFLCKVRNQGNLSICWAMAIISALEYMMGKNHEVDIALSPKELMDSLLAHLLDRNITPTIDEYDGSYSVPILDAVNWAMTYGILRDSDYNGEGYLHGSCPRESGLRVTYLCDFTKIKADNEELMLQMLRGGVCLCATIQIFPSLKKYKYDENAVHEGTEADGKKIVTHAVVITGFGITPKTRKKFWWFKNSWGEDWGDKGFGMLYRGFDAFNPGTKKRDLNLVIDIITCGNVKETVLK